MPGPTVVRLDYAPLYELGSREPIPVLLNQQTLQDVRRWGRDEIDAQTILEIMEQEVNGPEVDGQAGVSINEYTRWRMREDGFIQRILPPVPITNNELDRVDMTAFDQAQARRKVEEKMRQIALQQEVTEAVTIKPVTKRRKLIRE